MQRISTNMPNDDMQYHLRVREWKMNELQSNIAKQTRIGNLRDDPVSAAHSTRYQSLIKRLGRYGSTISNVQSDYRITEDYLRSANELVHRVRELAVQGANGSYSKEQKGMMAVEINQFLNELVEIGNARSADGESLFAGDRTDSLPFRATFGNVPGADGQVITGVMYTGGMAHNQAEVSEGSFVPTGFAGNRVFWAERNEVMADNDATTYVVQKDSSILIDGIEIGFKAGDNVHAIIARINDSAAAVRASMDPVGNSLVIQATSPHQLWLEDAAGGSVLGDLGMLSRSGSPPHNLAPDARTAGGSIFDMMIFLRDQLYNGETVDVGGAGLKGIDLGQSNLLTSLAEIGSRYNRLDHVQNRLAYEIPEIQSRNSREVDIDITQAITDLKMYEYTHKAALGAAGRILQPTLLDFLR
jgi:flagellar hook-associated protein 3 FlgL